MGTISNQRDAILVTGWCKATAGIITCLRQAGHPVTVYKERRFDATECHPISPNTLHLADRSVKVTSRLEDVGDFNLVIGCTDENEFQKRALIRQLEVVLAPDALIALNSESIPVSNLQQGALHPERIIGVNWTEPADTTFFLEIITNETNDQQLVEEFCVRARTRWQKDPYVVRSDRGIRTRMLSAMIREAFYLIENGYVSVEDIDRACRNDPGYYLPFSGHFRYMDLMGAFIYGVVMQDLFPELSKDRHIPPFFEELVKTGNLGMGTGKGFYSYETGELEQWEASFREFSLQIRQLIQKYPFNYEESPQPAATQPVVHE